MFLDCSSSGLFVYSRLILTVSNDSSCRMLCYLSKMQTSPHVVLEIFTRDGMFSQGPEIVLPHLADWSARMTLSPEDMSVSVPVNAVNVYAVGGAWHHDV
jgi:hypothetical protein